MNVFSGKEDISISPQKLNLADSLHLEIDKLKDPVLSENCGDTEIDIDGNINSDSEGQLSDESLPSSRSDDESDENQSENLLDSDEIRYKLQHLQPGKGGVHVRRKSITTVIPNWPARNAEAFKRGKEALNTLHLDPLSFSSDDLVHLTLEIFLELKLLSRLNIPEDKMQRFILAVRDRMLDNPYHNWTHIFDVTQTVYTLGTMTGVIPTLTDMECFALLISALCHDLEHPGVNNVYLIKSRSSLIALYSDEAILEKHHSFRAFELMLSSDIELLRGLSASDYNLFREMVMSIILATDMGRHNEYVAKLKTLTDESIKPEDRQVDKRWMMELLLKCADTSNVVKPFEVAKKWAMCVTNEFFLQGDMERANGFDITPMCDRRTQSRVLLQRGFIDFVIGPFYGMIGQLFPQLLCLVDQVKHNREAWNSYDDARLEAELGRPKIYDPPPADAMQTLRVVSWNMAAVNNNPFEYWITHQSEEYVNLMNDVQRVVDCPGSMDAEIHEILTDRMFSELLQDMALCGCYGLDEVERRWFQDYRNRLAISEFLKDRTIGSKRLISMPDRVTNTINQEEGPIMRPSVISGYQGRMSSTTDWWGNWRNYMFGTMVRILDRLSPGVYRSQPVCSLIRPINRSKYPVLSLEEEAISVPLQILFLAIFDAVWLQILQTVAGHKWHPIKMSLFEGFRKNKTARVMAILAQSYTDSDIIFIQEAAASFVDTARTELGDYMVLRPYVLDSIRNQNSFILVRRSRFLAGSRVDVTEQVIRLSGGRWTSPGDLCAMLIQGIDGTKFFLASFHGDTNGLATVPILKALDEAWRVSYPDHRFLFGLDANTQKVHGPNCQGWADFESVFSARGMGSCWGPAPSLSKAWTTRNARTYLQPQLQKAVGAAEAARKGDLNLKDWILFYDEQVTCEVGDTARDNTGDRTFAERMLFPTVMFPSDHAIVSALLTLKPAPPHPAEEVDTPEAAAAAAPSGPVAPPAAAAPGPPPSSAAAKSEPAPARTESAGKAPAVAVSA